MKQNEVLNLMRNLVNRENALIRLDESDVKYLTEEKEVEVISSFSFENHGKRMNDIIGQLQHMENRVKSYQRYILIVEYSPDDDFMMNEFELLSKYLKNVVTTDITQWSLYSNEGLNGLRVSLIMSR